ncbi:MAG: hypothetical protein ABW136_02025 [Steroidobacteraceae bacterium]
MSPAMLAPLGALALMLAVLPAADRVKRETGADGALRAALVAVETEASRRVAPHGEVWSELVEAAWRELWR